MLASELIQQLRDHINEHGDCVVVFDEDPDMEVDSVTFYEGKNLEEGDSDALMLGG